jgi:hypothetical protein
MARPKKQGLDYFPHDTDAMNDEKLEIMQLLYGNDGYAFYFKMLERIYRSPELMLDISDAETKKVMIKKCDVDEMMFDMMMQSCIKHGLFDASLFHEHGLITSDGIIKRAEIVLSKRQKMRQRYENQGVGVSDAETQQKHSRNTAEMMSETPQSKVKKSKEKKSKVNNKTLYGEFVELMDSEYESLVQKYGEQFTLKCIETLDNYKGATGTTYKSDYRAILNWVVERVRDRENRPVMKPQSNFQKPEKPKLQVVQIEQQQMPQNELDELYKLAARLDAKGG